MSFDIRLLWTNRKDYEKQKKGGNWTIKQEIKSETQNLKHMKANDEMRQPTQESILRNEQILAAREERSRAKKRDIVNTIVNIGNVVLCAFGLSRAYAIDKTDSIVMNKTTQSFFHKVFKL